MIPDRSALVPEVIGWYQVVGGAVGLAVTLGALLSGGGWGMLVPMALFGLPFVAGYGLVDRSRYGYVLSAAVQAGQVLSFALKGTGWHYLVGLALAVRVTPSTVYPHAKVGVEFTGPWGELAPEPMIVLNVLPILILVALWRSWRAAGVGAAGGSEHHDGQAR